jgi:hypothetical protein
MDALLGTTRFLDSHTAEVSEARIRAKKFLICTGAEPRIPPIAGLDSVPDVTYHTMFDNDRLPAHLLVIGGGPIGCEIAQAYRRLGAEVTIFAPRLLPTEEPEVSAILATVFADGGIRVIAAGAKSARTEANNSITVGSDAGVATGDLLLVATGRAPRVDVMGLEAAGVHFSKRGIEVNGSSADQCRTHLRRRRCDRRATVFASSRLAGLSGTSKPLTLANRPRSPGWKQDRTGESRLQPPLCSTELTGGPVQATGTERFRSGWSFGRVSRVIVSASMRTHPRAWRASPRLSAVKPHRGASFCMKGPHWIDAGSTRSRQPDGEQGNHRDDGRRRYEHHGIPGFNAK